ncbi:MAG: hypothetical protein HY821_00825 [Acidobacteria bacterium]|nr:hypothetical protein [Acidobacteriota bacterium]
MADLESSPTVNVLEWMDYRVRRLVEGLGEPGAGWFAGELEKSLEWLAGQLAGSPWRSRSLWRLRKPEMEDGHGERGWAIRLSKAKSELFCEVPVASGVFDETGARNKRACVDLAEDRGEGRYALIELKLEADSPERAAAEILRNFVLYLLARRRAPAEFLTELPLLQAKWIELRVWAPERYYHGRDCSVLEQALSKGLQGFAADFAFAAVSDDSKASEVDWGDMRQRARACAHREDPPFKRMLRAHLRGLGGSHLFDPAWRGLLRGPEHRYFDEPHSSQAFTLNLCAPLALDAELAREFLRVRCPGLPYQGERVELQVEAAIPGAGKWLGEEGIGTSPDFLIRVEGRGGRMGYVLGEVKLTESEFGGCRGWFDERHPPSRNEERERCMDARRIARNPTGECYMARRFGRRYWEHVDLARVSELAEPCPFREGLYQLMRNHALAKAAASEAPGVDWARFVVCPHAGNGAVRRLASPVAGSRDALEALRMIGGEDAAEVWDPRQMVEEVARLEPKLAAWREWMMARYFPDWV